MNTNNINRYLNRYNNISSLEIDNNPSNSANRARTRITRACDHCQLRKTKCDSAKPRCSQCVKRNDPCTFTTRVCKRGPKPKRLTYPYPSYDEKLPRKSHSIYPYSSYFSLNRRPIDLRINAYKKPDYRRSSHPLQSPTIYYNSSTYSSGFPASNYNNHNLPPIQTRSPPSLTPSSRTSSINLRLSGLSNNNGNFRLQSLENTLKLPPISNLFDTCNSLRHGRYVGQPAISSPSYYKLNNRRSSYPINL